MERVLGLDLGSRTCGIAMSDALGMIAHGVETYILDTGKTLYNVKEMLEKKVAGLNVVLVDERLTTKIAQDQLIFADVSRKKRKKVIDKMAAVAILQGYLDAN